MATLSHTKRENENLTRGMQNGLNLSGNPYVIKTQERKRECKKAKSNVKSYGLYTSFPIPKTP
ncbi:hypothetical protein CR513_38342, partial [Mucuna pruriens]